MIKIALVTFFLVIIFRKDSDDPSLSDDENDADTLALTALSTANITKVKNYDLSNDEEWLHLYTVCEFYLTCILCYF